MTGLQIRELTRSFGGIIALDDVSLEVRPGEIVGLIGPNGAGKTTLFNCISRLYDPDRGDILFDDHDLLKLGADDVVSVGIARTFQNVELFKTMTVIENLLVGQHSRTGPEPSRTGPVPPRWLGWVSFGLFALAHVSSLVFSVLGVAALWAGLDSYGWLAWVTGLVFSLLLLPLLVVCFWPLALLYAWLYSYGRTAGRASLGDAPARARGFWVKALLWTPLGFVSPLNLYVIPHLAAMIYKHGYAVGAAGVAGRDLWQATLEPLVDVAEQAARAPWTWARERLARHTAEEVVRFLDLEEVKDMPAGDLAFGIQKRVELARALVARPRLILLDEPASGLSHQELGRLGEVIKSVRDEFRVSILVVEHHMELVMPISDRICVLNFGRKIAEGTPAAVQKDPAVIEAYLGE